MKLLSAITRRLRPTKKAQSLAPLATMALCTVLSICSGGALAKALGVSSSAWTWIAGADYGIRTDAYGDAGSRPIGAVAPTKESIF